MLRVTKLVKKLPVFYELEGSLPCSQEYTTGHYPEAVNPFHTVILFVILEVMPKNLSKSEALCDTLSHAGFLQCNEDYPLSAVHNCLFNVF
jgi:hypothetical protein